MLILIPIFLLLLSAVAILVLRGVRPGFGYAWIIAAGGSLLAWIAILVLRAYLPLTFSLADWAPQDIFTLTPTLVLDALSWPYAFALATLILAGMLTATARLDPAVSPTAWACGLALTALGMAAALSANLFTAAIAWAALDLAALVIALTFAGDPGQHERVVHATGGRVMGIFVILWGLIAGQAGVSAGSAAAFPPAAGGYVLLGVALRLGLLPLRQSFAEVPSIRRGLGTVLRLVPAAAGLALLARLPGGFLSAGPTGLALALSALAAVYGGAAWARAKDEIQGRPFWLLAVSALAIAVTANGDPLASLGWGLALLLSGGMILFYNLHPAWTVVPVLLGLWGLSGLPYSPTAGSLRSLLSGPYWLAYAGLWLGQALLILGYVRHALRRPGVAQPIERWVLAVYPLGLLTLLAAQAYLSLVGAAGPREVGLWWAAGASLLAAAAGYLLLRIGISSRASLPSRPRQAAVRAFEAVFGLGWLHGLFRAAFRGVGAVIGVLTGVLEGDGGILWVLVLLALLVSLLGKAGDVL